MGVYSLDCLPAFLDCCSKVTNRLATGEVGLTNVYAVTFTYYYTEVT